MSGTVEGRMGSKSPLSTLLGRWCALVLLFGISGCNHGDPAPNPYGNGEAVEERFQPVAKAMQLERIRQGASASALAIVEGGKVTFARGFGSKNPGRDSDVSESTLFQVGSCTKAMTATAVLQAVVAGDVDLTAKVIDYLPEFHFTKSNSNVDEVTVYHLLTHTSGIVDALAESRADADRRDEALTKYVSGEFAESGYLMNPPGAFYNYSNPNYTLLGLIAERTWGTPFRTLLKERVLEPLGMNRSVLTPDDVEADGDYVRGAGCDVSNPNCPDTSQGMAVASDYDDNAWLRPAGGVWASVDELAKFAIFLKDGNEDVLANEQWQEMTRAQVNTHELSDLMGYGYGVSQQKGLLLGPNEFYELDVIGHTGSIVGYSAGILCSRRIDFCVVTLSSGEETSYPNTLVTAFSTLPELPEPTVSPDIASHPERYSQYAGTYVDANWLGKIEVYEDGHQLNILIEQFDDDGTDYSTKLEPMYSDSFGITVGGEFLVVSFLTDENGAYRYLRSRNAVGIRAD